MALGSCIASVATLFMGPVRKHWSDGGKRLTDIHRVHHFVHLITRTFLCSGSIWRFTERSFLQSLVVKKPQACIEKEEATQWDLCKT